MALGTLHAEWLIGFALAGSVSAALLWRQVPVATTRASRWVFVVSVALLFMTAFQAMPLPAWFVATLAPSNADAWQRALVPLALPSPAWHPLTVAPPATHIEILRGVLYLSVFLAALRIALQRGGSRHLEWLVVSSACLLALVTLGHSAVHAHDVFGIYAPREAHGYVVGRVGPLLNPNHVSAYVNVGACVALGIALEADRTSRVLGGGAAVLLTGTSVWVGSRGGAGALVLGVLLIVAVTAHRRRSRTSVSRGEAGIVLIAGVAAAALCAIGLSDVTRADFANRDISKLEMVRQAFLLVPRSPAFGVGRGAFETMYPLVRSGSSYFTFLRAENVAAQWMVEWGAPFALGAFALLALAFRPSVVLGARRPATGAWAAVVVAFVHDFVDFHLEVPGVVVLVSVAAAIVVGSRSTARQRARADLTGRDLRLQTLTARGVPLLAVVGSAVLLPNIGHALPEERDAIAELAMDTDVAQDAFDSSLKAAILRYPAEPFFPLAAAIRAQAIGRGGVVPWVGRALERYPRFGRAHLVLARSLARRHRAQARLEYRLAYMDDERVRAAVMREAPLLVDDIYSALELVPDGPEGADILESLASGLRLRLPATAYRVDAELSRRSPGAPGALRRRAEASISDLRNDHPWCDPTVVCAEPGLAAAEALVAANPEKCSPRVVLAEVMVSEGRTAEALDRLARSIEETSERGECLRQLVRLAMESGDRKKADAALEMATRAGCGSRADCLDLYTWAALAEERRGNTVRAIALHKRAAELTETDDHLVSIAQLAERAGLTGEALEAYRKLAARHPGDDRWRQHADALRDTSMKRQLGGVP